MNEPRKLFFSDIATLKIIDDGITRFSGDEVYPSAREVVDLLLDIRLSLTEANDE